MYPLTFAPVYKDYPWGGSRIPHTYNRTVPDGIYAESWEISDHDDGMSVVSNGPLAGKSLREIIQHAPVEIMGTAVKDTKFPLLIKLIDAKRTLSVQVHPNNETAKTFGGDAKTEMWYLLGENKPQVYCGLNDGITREVFEQAVDQGISGDTMHPIPVEKDSAVFVPGGCVHAIGEGCLILEIQQSSNTTYRIYDWDRMGNDGKPRELHIEQALNVINWENHSDPLVQPKIILETKGVQCSEIMACEYFRLEKLVISAPHSVSLDGHSFHALFVSEGDAVLRWGDGADALAAPAGTSILVPAALSGYSLEGTATLLRTTVPICEDL